jgi:hypothetical protein
MKDTITAFLWDSFREFYFFVHEFGMLSLVIGLLVLAFVSLFYRSMLKQLARYDKYFEDSEANLIFVPLSYIFGTTFMYFSTMGGVYDPAEGIGVTGWIALFFLVLTTVNILHAGITLLKYNTVKACVLTPIVIIGYLLCITMLLPSFFVGFLLYAFLRSFIRMLLPYRLVGFAIDKFDRIWSLWDK